MEFLGKSDNFFSSGDMHSRWVSHYVASSEGPGVIAAGTTGTWNNVPMLIPATAPSRLAGCGIINANYVLEVCQALVSLTVGQFSVLGFRFILIVIVITHI